MRSNRARFVKPRIYLFCPFLESPLPANSPPVPTYPYLGLRSSWRESGRNRELLRNFPKLRNPCRLMATGPLLVGHMGGDTCESCKGAEWGNAWGRRWGWWFEGMDGGHGGGRPLIKQNHKPELVCTGKRARFILKNINESRGDPVLLSRTEILSVFSLANAPDNCGAMQFASERDFIIATIATPIAVFILCARVQDISELWTEYWNWTMIKMKIIFRNFFWKSFMCKFCCGIESKRYLDFFFRNFERVYS